MGHTPQQRKGDAMAIVGKETVISAGDVKGILEWDSDRLLLMFMGVVEPISRDEAASTIEVLNKWLGKPSTAVVTEEDVED